MSSPRQELADLLKQSRIDAGYTSQGEFAQAMSITRAPISRAENGKHPVPSRDLLSAWAGVTGIPEQKLTELADRCKSGTPEWFLSYRLAESEATTVRIWAPLIMPGVVQTEAYAHEVISANPATAAKRAELVAMRIERQQVTQRAYVTLLIYESVLTRLIGTPKIMTEQCAYLVELAQRPNVAIHVVPDAVNTGAWGEIDIATRSGSSTVCLGTGLDDVTTVNADVADNALRTFERVLGSSYSPAESLECLRNAAAHWEELDGER